MQYQSANAIFIEKIKTIHGCNNLICEFCGKTAMVRQRGSHDKTRKDDATVEHLVPRTICNHDNHMNFRICCYGCNQIRSAWACRARLRKIIRGEIEYNRRNGAGIRTEWVGIQAKIKKLEAMPHKGRKNIRFNLGFSV